MSRRVLGALSRQRAATSPALRRRSMIDNNWKQPHAIGAGIAAERTCL
jgi:hypothetical protein